MTLIGFICLNFGLANPTDALAPWTIINTFKFGDTNNFQACSLVQYGDYLYSGTYNTATGAEIWRYDLATWTQVNTDGFGDVNNEKAATMFNFNGTLYVGTNNTTTGVEIWQYDESTWSRANIDGFGDAATSYIYDFEEYNGNFYSALRNTTLGACVFAYNTGTNWANVTHTGNAFGDANNTYTRSLKTYDGDLYASTFNDTTGTEIWKYAGSGSTWTQVNTDGFGDANNEYAVLEVYGDDLYAGTGNVSTGVEIWKYDGSTWTQVNTNGFGSALRADTYDLTVYNNRLYAGTNPYDLFEYNGTSWTNVPAPTDGTPVDYEVYAGRFFAGTGIGSVEVSTALVDLVMSITATYEEVASYNITYTVTVTNNGTDDANNVYINAQIPDESTFVSASGTGWSCGNMGPYITCYRPTLAAGTNAAVNIVVHVEDEGQYELVASVGSDTFDSNLTDNDGSLSQRVTQLATTGANILLPMLAGAMFLVLPFRTISKRFQKTSTK